MVEEGAFILGVEGVVPCRTAREERRPAIELQKACRESFGILEIDLL